MITFGIQYTGLSSGFEGCKVSFYGKLLPDCMFIRKMLQSDRLYYETWTIYTFPYEWSGPFMQHLITVKTQVFGKLENKLLTRDREKLVLFGKLSVKFQKLFGKMKTTDYNIFSRVLPSARIF